MKQLKPGDMVRLKTRMLSGYKGEAVVINHPYQSDTVEILKDVDEVNENGRSHCYTGRHELTLIRRKTE